MDREEDRQPSRHLRGNLIGIALLLAVLGGAIVFTWRPWDRDSCIADEHHVIDVQSRLCYVVPEGWEQTGEMDLAYYATSELRTATVNGDVLVEVTPAFDSIFSDAGSGDGLDEAVLQFVESTYGMESSDAEFESETMKVNGRDAATATARRPVVHGDENELVTWQWARVTVVIFSDRASVMLSEAWVDEVELEADDGVIADLNEIHDSIAVPEY